MKGSVILHVALESSLLCTSSKGIPLLIAAPRAEEVAGGLRSPPCCAHVHTRCS